MKALRQILVATIIALTMSAGSFASFGQHNNNSNTNRPPKEDQRIKERDKHPPSNTNSNRPGKPN